MLITKHLNCPERLVTALFTARLRKYKHSADLHIFAMWITNMISKNYIGRNSVDKNMTNTR